MKEYFSGFDITQTPENGREQKKKFSFGLCLFRCKIFSGKYFQICGCLFHCKMVVKRKIISVD
jgi:hypothetical protein